jgi:CTD kinase subunit alpha
LLFGTTKYGAEIDIWGMGCIMVEMFSKGKPLFAGTDEVTQLQMIMKIKGSDIKSEWEGVTQLPWYSFMKPKEEYPNTLRRRLRYKFTERNTYNLS